MIAGAAGWLLWPSTPPAWLGATIFAAGTVAAIAFRAWPSAQMDGGDRRVALVLAGLAALGAASGLGMTAATLRAWSVAQPALPALETPVEVEGWVAAIDASDSGLRLRILVRSVEGVEAPPRYMRVAVPSAGVLTPGRAARCYAQVGPPAGPMAPGAYDFARRAWFERLGGTGFGIGRCRPIALAPPPSWLDRQRLQLAAMRSDLSAAILEAAPGRGGAIAAALVTGDRSSIDEATNIALRDSGLGHLLSVSGIHMGVVGGLVFASLLWTLSLIAPLALRVPVKKVAAVGALTALAAYLIVSGSSVPALRAFVMACVAFGAILLDRPAISMRGLALAALIVVLIFPESVIEPGFQMSFAATMALVALFEMNKRAPHEPALPTPGPLIGALQATMRGIIGVILISLVAGIATDPFAIYHFQRFSIYSLPANLITAPIMSFLVAPAAGAAAVFAPFGLADPALELMASALDLVAAIAQTFGTRPEAIRALPQPPDLAFVACVLALIWACLWRGALRWAGIALFAASLLMYATADRPVVAFDADLRATFARDGGAWTLMRGAGRSTYARDRLGGMLGIAPSAIERLAEPSGCGELLCAWRTPSGVSVFSVRDATAFDAACVEGAIVISKRAAPAGYAARCRLLALIDAANLATHGGGFVYDSADGTRVMRALPDTVQRPWRTRASADQE